ncbi:MAG: Serine/threonine-protein kinase PrkC [Pelotomaculum sp. PtaU1.Bin035]|nr:MAG: Serine/threonine-protein kinase PrkC [Pelotomaculum sp. PtaU1.Bin035]
MIGKLLGNRYEILEQLGGGGMAIVYKGRDTILNRLVTIKVLRPEFTSDEDFVKRFRREAQAVASLSHPNIVSIYDVGRADAVDYLVMEYVEGDNLKNLIRGQGALPPGRAMQIARQVCDALEHAHESNIVHRDVKPQNILITRSGRAKLTDFGIARGATAATLTQTDAIVGSVHYLSPEQARGEVAGPRSDIYSLGIVLYEMVAGSLPFQGDSPISVALKHIQDEPPRLSSLNPAVPLRLEKIVARAMAKDPAGRYETAGQMAADLEETTGVEFKETSRFAPVDEFATRVLPTVRRPAGDVRPAEHERTNKKRRSSWLWAALIIIGLLGAGAAAYMLYFNVPEISMPAVEGETLELAKSILIDKGIKDNQITVGQNNSSTVPQGKVISQNPPAGTKIKVTRSVTLTVSQGVELREVPDVTGDTLSNAREAINKKDLIAVDQQGGYSSVYAQGVVMDQVPKPGDKVPKGSTVTLTVSKGPQPIQVPDLTGKTLDQARSDLVKLKLKLDESVDKVSSTVYLAGQIVAQTPPKGTEVQENYVVHATLSDGPGPSRRSKKLEFAILPDDKQEHELRIVVKDVRGSTDVYAGTHAGGEKVTREITYYGKATVQAYIDGNLKGEQTLE